MSVYVSDIFVVDKMDIGDWGLGINLKFTIRLENFCGRKPSTKVFAKFKMLYRHSGRTSIPKSKIQNPKSRKLQHWALGLIRL